MVRRAEGAAERGKGAAVAGAIRARRVSVARHKRARGGQGSLGKKEGDGPSKKDPSREWLEPRMARA